MRLGWALGLMLAACSFRPGQLVGDDGPGDAAGEGAPVADASIDALTARYVYVATTTSYLFAVDLATMQTAQVGPLRDPNATSTQFPIDGLGFAADGSLVGVTASPTRLVRIDPLTASVTVLATPTSHTYWGATVAPAGTFGTDAMILVATNDTATLYEMRLDGTLRTIGPFGNGLKVAGDIAYVPGQGLFASVVGAGCTGTCIAKVETSGQATLRGSTGPSDMWALAAFGGNLYAVGGSGHVYLVNTATGATTQLFNTQIPSLADAAP